MLILSLSLALWSPARGAGSQEPIGDKSAPPNVEQAIMRLEREWMAAAIKRDASVYERIEADDFVFIDAEGVAYTKAEDIADLKSGALVMQSANIDEMNVRVYGNAAVVTGRRTLKGKYKGKDLSSQYRFTDVFVNRGGRWQAVSAHSSRIAKP
jgi:ketosteroid isomerase-like protein